MKKVIRLTLIIIAFASFSGCALHTGIMSGSASLSDANFTYTQQSISGFAETTKIFMIGGLDKEALVEEAKANMLANHKLQPNQALANVAVDWKNSFYIVVMKTKCTVTADIVEFK